MKKIIYLLLILAFSFTAANAKSAWLCGQILFYPEMTPDQLCQKLGTDNKAMAEKWFGSLTEYKRACINELYPAAKQEYDTKQCEKVDVQYTKQNGVTCTIIKNQYTYSKSCSDGTDESNSVFH